MHLRDTIIDREKGHGGGEATANLSAPMLDHSFIFNHYMDRSFEKTKPP